MDFLTIGDRIKHYRKLKGMTQSELGEKLCVSQALIGQYETNKRTPKLAQLGKFANVFNIDVKELIGDDFSVFNTAFYVGENEDASQIAQQKFDESCKQLNELCKQYDKKEEKTKYSFEEIAKILKDNLDKLTLTEKKHIIEMMQISLMTDDERIIEMKKLIEQIPSK